MCANEEIRSNVNTLVLKNSRLQMFLSILHADKWNCIKFAINMKMYLLVILIRIPTSNHMFDAYGVISI